MPRNQLPVSPCPHLCGWWSRNAKRSTQVKMERDAGHTNCTWGLSPHRERQEGEGRGQGQARAPPGDTPRAYPGLTQDTLWAHPRHTWDMPRTYLRHALGSPGAHPRHTRDTLGHTWDMPRTHLRHAWDSPGAHLGLAWSSSGARLRHTRDTLGHTWDMPRTQLRYTQDTSGAHLRGTWGSPQYSLAGLALVGSRCSVPTVRERMTRK